MTYHSTRILRHLFTVHTSVAEFDLAFRAFESYREIVSRARARTEKSNVKEHGFDDDDTVLRTTAEAIRVLCRFGTRKEAERARDIEKFASEWLERQVAPGAFLPSAAGLRGRSSVSSLTAATVYRAIGISGAHWARFTYDTSARVTLQAEAAGSLRKAADIEGDHNMNLNTLYALGLLLAEMRDIPGAIAIVKRALSSPTTSHTSTAPDGYTSADATEDAPNSDLSSFLRERKLIPLWHLLALLLTARSDFTMGEKACEAAFQQFLSPTNLFGGDNQGPSFKSDHLNSIIRDSTDDKHKRYGGNALVDRMGNFEKEGLIQLKITQLNIVALLDGPGAAIEASDELLALYARLFGDPKVSGSKQLPRRTDFAPPKSAAGTVKSLVGSVLGRSKHSQRHSRKPVTGQDQALYEDTNVASRTTTLSSHTTAPAIHVTNEDGAARSSVEGHAHPHLHHLLHRKDHPEQTHRQPSVLRKRSGASLRKRRSSPPPVPGTDLIESRDHAVDGNAQHSNSSIVPQSSKQDVHLPAPFTATADREPPEPKFTEIQARRHTISLLIQVWLFIASLYTGAALYEDAIGAVNEAQKLVESLELEISQESSSCRAFAERGWGGGKTVEQLWADVWAEVSSFLPACRQCLIIIAWEYMLRPNIRPRGAVTLRKSPRSLS